MINLEKLNAIAKTDTDWKKSAEYRTANKERLYRQAKEKLIELRRKQDENL
jgi:hypothetical protein